jgi:hypothetical protein
LAAQRQIKDEQTVATDFPDQNSNYSVSRLKRQAMFVEETSDEHYLSVPHKNNFVQ